MSLLKTDNYRERMGVNEFLPLLALGMIVLCLTYLVVSEIRERDSAVEEKATEYGVDNLRAVMQGFKELIAPLSCNDATSSVSLAIRILEEDTQEIWFRAALRTTNPDYYFENLGLEGTAGLLEIPGYKVPESGSLSQIVTELCKAKQLNGIEALSFGST